MSGLTNEREADARKWLTIYKLQVEKRERDPIHCDVDLDLSDFVPDLLDELDAVRAERDALLSAAKLALSALHHTGYQSALTTRAADAMTEAIAKVAR